MTKEVWLNLPIKDQKRSKEFFTAIGFTFKDDRSNPTMLAMMAGAKNFPIMLFDETTFAHVMQHPVSDTTKGSEMMISFDAESREEVDEIAEKVTGAGGNVFAPPTEIRGWMYGAAFTDPDGHRWNVLYMDMGKMPQ